LAPQVGGEHNVIGIEADEYVGRRPACEGIEDDVRSHVVRKIQNVDLRLALLIRNAQGGAALVYTKENMKTPAAGESLANHRVQALRKPFFSLSCSDDYRQGLHRITSRP
jgi:hypothetical protein